MDAESKQQVKSEDQSLREAQPIGMTKRADSAPSRQAQWDKEQVQKIQATLRMTIDELQDELNRKEEELDSYKERGQRERSRLKQLEDKIRSREAAERDAERLRHQLETDLRDAEQEISKEQKHCQSVSERAQGDRVVRGTLEEQIETLNEVNAALEQRCNALIRCVELSASVMQDCQELKMQLRDAEIDNETLVRTVRRTHWSILISTLSLMLSSTHTASAPFGWQIRDVKDQHFVREKELKAEIEKAKDETRQAEAQVKELEADLTSLRTQNSLFSEWMLVRNENAMIAKKSLHEASSSHASPFSPQSRYTNSRGAEESTERQADGWHQHHHSHCSPHVRSQHLSSRAGLCKTSPEQNGAPISSELSTTARKEKSLYVHTSRAPLSPTKAMSMTTASPAKQQPWRAPSPFVHDANLFQSAPTSDSSARDSCKTNRSVNGNIRANTESPHLQRMRSATTTTRTPRKMSTGSVSSSSSSSTTASSTNADHERLRLLMSRNRELQQRLQRETLATQNLEQEITNITTSYHGHRQNY